MAVGVATTAQLVNDRAGGVIVNLWNALNDVRNYYLWLADASHNDAFLNGLGITGTAATGDVKLLRDSLADLGGSAGLWSVSHGLVAPSGASNYFANAKQLTGVAYTG